LTFFIYFSLIAEILLLIMGLTMFFLPGIVAKWAAIVILIFEFPVVASAQVVITISDTGTVGYARFGIPLIFLTPFLYLFLILVFVAVENLFDVTERDFFGRKRSKP